MHKVQTIGGEPGKTNKKIQTTHCHVKVQTIGGESQAKLTKRFKQLIVKSKTKRVTSVEEVKDILIHLNRQERI